MGNFLKKHKFGLILICWVLLLAIAGTGVILYLRNYLEEYELSRPEHLLESYETQVKAGEVALSDISTLDEIDRRLQTEEEAVSYIRGILSDVSFYKALEECTDDRYVYRIRHGKDLVGQVVMTAVGETSHGFTLWEVSSSEFYFDQYLKYCETIIPESYTVLVNGKQLDSSYISQKDIRYGTLSAFYDTYDGLPTLVQYTSGRVLGEAEMTVKDPQGNVVSEEDMTEMGFLSKAYPSGREEELTTLCSEFVIRYSKYTSNFEGNSGVNYGNIKTLVIPESDLHNRLRKAVDSLYYIWATRCEITEENINIMCRLKENLYFADVSYTVDSDGGVTTSNIRLIIVPDDHDTLKAETMSTY